MTKEQILKLTGLTEAEFYKKYPSKEAFYKDYPNAKRKMERGGDMSGGSVNTADLNKDRMRTTTRMESDLEAGLRGAAESLAESVPIIGPLLKAGMDAGVKKFTDSGLRLNQGTAHSIGAGTGATIGAAANTVMSLGMSGAFGGAGGAGKAVSTPFTKSVKSTGQITPKLIQSGFNVQDALKKVQQIQNGTATSYVPGMYDTGVYTAMNGGMYRDGGVMNNTSNLGLTDLKGPRHADGGIALNEDVEVEGEETIYTPERYVFSEVMKASKDALKEAGLSPSYEGRSYSSISRSFKNSVDTLRGSEDKLAQRAVDQKLKKLINAHEVDRANKREREARNVVAQTPEERAGGYNMFPDAESIMFPGQGPANVVPADNQMPIEVTGADGSQQILTNSPIQTQAPFMERKMAAGGMLKRADGSYSKRGLWDNIRAKAAANKRAGKKGKKPTKEMLEQERKIKAAEKAMGGYYYLDGGYMAGDGSDQPDGSYWRSSDDMSYMYGGDLKNYNTIYAGGGKLMYQQDIGVLPDNIKNLLLDARNAVFNYDKNIEPILRTDTTYNIQRINPNGIMKDVNIANRNSLISNKSTPYLQKVMQAEGGKLPEGILRSRLESHMSPSEVDNYMESYAYGGNLGRTNYDVYVNSPSYFRAEGGSFDNPGFKALPTYVQNKIKSNMEDGGELYMGEMPEYADMEGYELDEDEAMNYGEGGSYRVYKSNERKGKTHKVVGPGGKVKYFGDPKLGERSKSKYGKKAFYARHRKNLAKNPFFRAYARATWEDGGYTSLTPQGLTFTPTINRETGGEFGSPDNNYYFGDASGSYLTAMQQGGMMPMGAPQQAAPSQGDQMQQIMQAVVQMLQEGNQPENVVKALIENGLPQEAAAQIVGAVIQELQGGGQEQMAMEQQAMPMQGAPMEMQQAPQMGAPMMAYGGPMQYKKGGIYIKPSKRGSFTAWAKRHDMGVQEAARHVMANKEDYSSAIVKKANFAKNAAGWKHAMGGKMMYQQGSRLLSDAGYAAINQFENTVGKINPVTGQPTSMNAGDQYAQTHPDHKKIEEYINKNIGIDNWNKMPDNLRTQIYSFMFNHGNYDNAMKGLNQAVLDSTGAGGPGGVYTEFTKDKNGNLIDESGEYRSTLSTKFDPNVDYSNPDIYGNYINVLGSQYDSIARNNPQFNTGVGVNYVPTLKNRAVAINNILNPTVSNTTQPVANNTTPVVNQPVIGNSSPLDIRRGIIDPSALEAAKQKSLQNQPVVTNAGPTPATTGGAAQRMMQTYFPNPLLKNTAQQPLTGFPLLSYGVTKEGQEAELRPYSSSIAPYIAGGIGSAVGPIANMIAAAAIPDATYTAPAKMQRLGYTPVALARQQANQAIASTREGMRMGAPTQGSYLGNLAVSLPSTASALGSLLAQTRYGIDSANADIANKEALNRQAVAQQNALLKDQSIAQRWNLGLAGAEGIGKGVQGFTRDLTQRSREDEMLRNMRTQDFSALQYVEDPNNPGTFKMVPTFKGAATYNDAQGNQIVTDANGKKYMVVGNTLKEIVQ